MRLGPSWYVMHCPRMSGTHYSLEMESVRIPISQLAYCLDSILRHSSAAGNGVVDRFVVACAPLLPRVRSNLQETACQSYHLSICHSFQRKLRYSFMVKHVSMGLSHCAVLSVRMGRSLHLGAETAPRWSTGYQTALGVLRKPYSCTRSMKFSLRCSALQPLHAMPCALCC